MRIEANLSPVVQSKPINLEFKTERMETKGTYEDEIHCLQHGIQKLEKNWKAFVEDPERRVNPGESAIDEVLRDKALGKLMDEISKLNKVNAMFDKRLASLEVDNYAHCISVASNVSDFSQRVCCSNPVKDTSENVSKAMPPESAKLLNEGETFEDFFKNNIEEFLRKAKASSSPSQQKQKKQYQNPNLNIQTNSVTANKIDNAVKSYDLLLMIQRFIPAMMIF